MSVKYKLDRIGCKSPITIKNLKNTFIHLDLCPTYYFYISGHLSSIGVVINFQRNIIKRLYYKLYGILLSIPSTVEFDLTIPLHKYIAQERDEFTCYDNFRYHSSPLSRLFKPYTIIQNTYRPSSRNLYSYIKGKPLNFSDLSGHMYRQIGHSQIDYAPWMGISRIPELEEYLWGDGGGGTQSSGYWKPIYGTIVTTSGEPVWNEELQAWVGLEVTVTWGIVGYQYVEWVDFGGQQLSPFAQTNPMGLPKSVFIGKTPLLRWLSAQSVGFQLAVVQGLGFAVIGGGIGTLSANPAGTAAGGSIGFLVGFFLTEWVFWEIAKQETEITLEPLPPGIGQFRYQTMQLEQYEQQQSSSSGRK